MDSSKQIIIIGSGIAGLAACHTLESLGQDVMILEARNRAGGRIYTDHSLGIPLNFGAGWIHGIDGNPMTQLAKKALVSMETFDQEKNILYDRNGSQISQNKIHEFNEKFELILQRAKKIAFQSQHDISLSQAIGKVLDINKLSTLEQDLFQSKLEYFEGYIGANYELLSARYWNLEESWPGDNCYLTGTYQPIIDHLTSNCHIQFNSIVKEIHLRKNDIEIVTEHSVFYAEFVIITLPLGVLQKNDVIFNPPLPKFKQKAIHQLGMGLLNVTAIKFPRTFWPDCLGFRLNFGDDNSIPIFFDLHHFLGNPILIGYQGGMRARQIEKMSEAELLRLTMDNFRKIFGKSIPEPEGYATTRWSQDIFSYGSYSYLSVGASSQDYEAMAQSIDDRLFFAGEATHSKFLATTHGAYLSGIREANRIKELISKKKN